MNLDEALQLADAPEAGSALAVLAAEVRRLEALTYCKCGDQFTGTTPGVCWSCQADDAADAVEHAERRRDS